MGAWVAVAAGGTRAAAEQCAHFLCCGLSGVWTCLNENVSDEITHTRHSERTSV